MSTDVRDPELDPTATYRLDQQAVRRLTARVRASGDSTQLVCSPIDGAPLGMIPQSSPEDVAAAFARARAAQRRWAHVPVVERQRLLLGLHDLILQQREEITDLIVSESGKARKHAFDEVMHVAMTARYYGLKSAAHLASDHRSGVLPGLTRVQVNHVPKGVVGIISPWNYPFTMALADGLPALMAGNAVVAKPDAQATLTALLGMRLLEEAGFPVDLWQIVAGSGEVIGTEITQRADYVCFTGSTATGRLIARQCADRLIGCSLELGGKNPMLVLRDADPDRAAEGAVRAAFSNSGQLCVSMERLFVADQIYDRFAARFVERTRAMTFGDPMQWATDMGPLVSQDQLDKVTAHVDDAVAKGATVLTGGRPRADLGRYFFEPTILEGVTPAMTCFGSETFGPVISLYPFHSETEVIDRANEGSYGLNASIYSRDVSRARALAARIRCGSVNINEAFAASFASLDSPMGGMRDSGSGRRQGSEGIRRYVELQTVAAQRLMKLGPLPGMSDEQWGALLVRNERIMRKLRRA
ncbi:MAG: succinate-semialdehyde dehydrogenase (NADP(+)) [Nocardioidaceae bacterium]|nr:MAG: succinate-semialdehyde dehydrogenase (NADP(+)) [Nocardioidaceae bacterium]